MELAIKDLTVKIAGQEILKNISLTFAIGKRTAIIGPNGAGKSTLLKAVAGLNNNYAGSIKLNGQEIRNSSRKKIAQQMAFLPQGAAVPADITVYELANYGRFPYRSLISAGNPKADRAAVEWALAVTKLTKLAARKVQTLSGGERQRAFLAMALAQKPKILLLDEPTTYLDIAHQLEVMNIIEELNKKYNMTIIMVLHDINHALQYTDVLALLKDKNIIAAGNPADILDVAMLAKVFGVQADVFTNSQGKAVLSPVALVKS